MARRTHHKPKKAPPQQKKAPPQHKPSSAPERRPDWPIAALAGLGLLITGYLVVVAVSGTGLALCGAESGCDIVQSSRWSTLLGVPMAAWGFGLYALIAAAALGMPARLKRWRRVSFLALLGIAVSAYLTVVGLIYLQAVCAWCLASFAVISAIFVTALLRRPATAPGGPWLTWSANGLLTALLVIAALFIWQTDLLRPENPRLKALAQHLDEHGAHFYGASWCPACQQQKRRFGSSAERLPYVECSPNGRGGARAAVCEQQHISQYPTWVIDGRHLEGTRTPAELARLSGFPWQEGG